jgi:hypothetical protein
MSLNWPNYDRKNMTDQNAVGDAIEVMVAKEQAQAAVNQRQLQAARAAEAKRQRDESLAASRVLNTTVSRG